jgi:hypothetical protein
MSDEETASEIQRLRIEIATLHPTVLTDGEIKPATMGDLMHAMEAQNDLLIEAIKSEREACAKIAEDWGERQPVTNDDCHIPGANHGERFSSAGIAAAIRERGKT